MRSLPEDFPKNLPMAGSMGWTYTHVIRHAKTLNSDWLLDL